MKDLNFCNRCFFAAGSEERSHCLKGESVSITLLFYAHFLLLHQSPPCGDWGLLSLQKNEVSLGIYKGLFSCIGCNTFGARMR